MSAHRSYVLVVASVSLVGLLALSGAQPYDRTTWALEVFHMVIAFSHIHDRQIQRVERDEDAI